MAITKTDFLNYSRCKRYVALEEVNKEKLDADVSWKDYKEQEYESELQELFDSMFEYDDTGKIIDKTSVVNKQLEAMLPYYKQVEAEAGKLALKQFGGSVVYAEKTKEQISFDFSLNGIRYLCYVDVYNEKEEEINIIEVKATTSKKYTDLASGFPKKDKYSIFTKRNNIYYLKGEIENYPLDKEMEIKKYEEERSKLFDRYKLGAYIHDLAVQRYFIEGEYKESHQEDKLKNIHYYLAVLNQKYIFDGTYENDKPVYHTDEKGEELITFFALDEVTLEYQKFIDEERINIEKYILDASASPCPLGASCGFKTQNVCKYFKEVCGKKIPEKNSSLSYVNNGFGFKKEDGTRIKGLELINENYLNMLDIPEEWIMRKNHHIQRECLKENKEYINKEKIRSALNTLEYPIYHLDFETFPCPLPRFKGEFPYIQSPFEFSLHIENKPGECDKQNDNIIFLAATTKDEREEMIKQMLKYMDPDKGTLFAQNVSFEKGRIKELATIFPEYKESLMKLYNRGFDLLWLLNNQKELYKSLGFSGEDLETFNFYDARLSGSFSIKKTLPIFSNLSYKNLVVKNGTEAIIEYANYDKMSKEELKLKQEALKIYCQQDTWAMVEILDALRKLVS